MEFLDKKDCFGTGVWDLDEREPGVWDLDERGVGVWDLDECDLVDLEDILNFEKKDVKIIFNQSFCHFYLKSHNNFSK